MDTHKIYWTPEENHAQETESVMIQHAHNFHKDCNAEVFVIFYHNDKYHIYTSNTQSAWPPPLNEILSFNPEVNTAESVERCQLGRAKKGKEAAGRNAHCIDGGNANCGKFDTVQLEAQGSPNGGTTDKDPRDCTDQTGTSCVLLPEFRTPSPTGPTHSLWTPPQAPRKQHKRIKFPLKAEVPVFEVDFDPRETPE
ncbi:hypothetical protein F4774DRAFT_421350 [Daldinia eschscholtzii]|nr:hypothetical protein F4774DRAFT_421350 [Daldinia eschscholtzii]